MRGARPGVALVAHVAAELALRPGETLVCAVSGGSDSVALAVLAAAAAEVAHATVVLAHVNHALRPSAWQDEAVTYAVAARLGVRAVARSLRPGPADEARLRDERYAALVEIARACGAGRIATAHHARDQTETVLLALFRGTGPAGLAGMAARRTLAPGVSLERPLLAIEPDALAAIVARLGLPVARDPSNADPAYRRNAVRSALADLRPSFPGLDAAVARAAAIAASEDANDRHAAVRRELRALLGEDARDVGSERLDAATKAVARGARRIFLRRGVELVVE